MPVATGRRCAQRHVPLGRSRTDRDQHAGRLRHERSRRRRRRGAAVTTLGEAEPTIATASRTGGLSLWLRRRAAPLIVFALLFVLWEVAVHLTGIKEYLLPPPSKVWTEFLKRYDIVMDGAWVTTQEIIAGYLLAVVVSIPLALTVAYSRFVETAIYPVVVFLQIIPKIAIAPLFIIWFGFGFTPKLLLVFLLSFFPIVVASIAGFKSV